VQRRSFLGTFRPVPSGLCRGRFIERLKARVERLPQRDKRGGKARRFCRLNMSNLAFTEWPRRMSLAARDIVGRKTLWVPRGRFGSATATSQNGAQGKRHGGVPATAHRCSLGGARGAATSSTTPPSVAVLCSIMHGRCHADDSFMGLRIIGWVLKTTRPFSVWMSRHPWRASMLVASPFVLWFGLRAGSAGVVASLLIVPVLRIVMFLAGGMA